MDYFAVGVMAFECMFGRVSYFEITIDLETICGEILKGNQRSYSIKVDLDQEK